MDESQDVLVGIPEPHASADAGLEVRCAPGHVECDHALVLVPDIHHAVQLLISAVHNVPGQEPVPVLLQFAESLVHLLRCGELFCHLPGFFLIYYIGSFPLVIRVILDIAQHEDYFLLFAGQQRYVEAVRSNG